MKIKAYYCGISERINYKFLVRFYLICVNFNKFSDVEASNNAELNKRTRTIQSQNKAENKPQTRQTREAGASTYSDDVIINNSKTSTQIIPSEQTNKFKPAIETSAGGNIQNDDKLNTKPELSDQEGSQDIIKKAPMNKSRSFGSSSWQLRERVSKNSTKTSNLPLHTGKNDEVNDDLAADEELNLNNNSQSSLSFTGSTGEELVAKRRLDFKTNQKPSRKLNKSKNKEDKSANESSDKSDSAEQTFSRRAKICSRKEEICLGWMKSLNKLESELNMEPESGRSDMTIPEYCSNRICPISEGKIQKSNKVLKQSKKVLLRKALFGDNDENWYCLKWLKAHEDEFYWFYCGQIYFMDESELGDDGKAWICWDTCDKWVSRSFSKKHIISYLILYFRSILTAIL